jgi:hypothetical protein
VRGVRTSDTMEDTGISGCSMTLVLRIRLRRGGDAFLGRMRVEIGMRRGTEEGYGARHGFKSSESIHCRYKIMKSETRCAILCDLCESNVIECGAKLHICSQVEFKKAKPQVSDFQFFWSN